MTEEKMQVASYMAQTTSTPASAYESLRGEYLDHVQTGCCNYGLRLGVNRVPTRYYTVWNFCPKARAIR